MNLYTIGGLIILILTIFLLIYKLGKNAKENEIKNNNEELKKKYAKKKFNSIDDVIDSL